METYNNEISYCGKTIHAPRAWVTDEENYACYIHDCQYSEIENPYWKFNAADAAFIENLKAFPNTSCMGVLMRYLFILKRVLLS